MNRKVTIIVLISLFLTVQVFAQAGGGGILKPELRPPFKAVSFINKAPVSGNQVYAQTGLLKSVRLPPFKSVVFIAASVEDDEQIPEGIRNNEYYLESVRLTKLANDTYDYGDYDASAGFAQEAVRYAALSDQYVSEQLIAVAERYLVWADSNNIAARYRANYNEGKNYYDSSVSFHSDESWNDAIASATKAIEIFAALEAGHPLPVTTTTTTTTAATGLAAQYTVRTWARERDCLWNIAGYSWVYNDPWKWRVLYEANKSKLPDPNNPNLIEPGTVLDIPSVSGETRQGMWQPR